MVASEEYRQLAQRCVKFPQLCPLRLALQAL